MKLIKYFLFISILIISLFFFVKLDSMNVVGDIANLDPSSPIKIQIPFLIDIPAYENGFKVWLVLVMTLTSGVIIGFVLALFQIFSQKKEIFSLKSQLRRIRVELDSLRNQSVEDDMEIIDEMNDSSL